MGAGGTRWAAAISHSLFTAVILNIYSSVCRDIPDLLVTLFKESLSKNLLIKMDI